MRQINPEADSIDFTVDAVVYSDTRMTVSKIEGCITNGGFSSMSL